MTRAHARVKRKQRVPHAPQYARGAATMSGATFLRISKCSTNIQSALLIYNLACGRRRSTRFAEIEEAARILNAAGIRTELAPTTGRGSATGIARHAVAQNRDLVITCGGDGTVNEVINGLAGSQRPHGVTASRHRKYPRQRIRHPLEYPRRRPPDSHQPLRRIALGSVHERHRARRNRRIARPPLFSLRSRRRPRWRHGPRRRSRTKRSRRHHRLSGPKASAKSSNIAFPKMSISRPNSNLNATLIVVGRTANYGGPFKITHRRQPLRRQFRNRRLHHNTAASATCCALPFCGRANSAKCKASSPGKPAR